jgi:hypothetical protein
MVKRNDEHTPRSALEERAKAAFDDSVDNLDGRTRSALTRARYAAVEELAGNQRSRAWKVWGPLSGVTAAALVIAVMFGPMWTTTQMPPQGSAMPFEDFDIVADAENLELLEDLDFYAWLDSAGALPSG